MVITVNGNHLKSFVCVDLKDTANSNPLCREICSRSNTAFADSVTLTKGVKASMLVDNHQAISEYPAKIH
jgi:hypothetical protein